MLINDFNNIKSNRKSNNLSNYYLDLDKHYPFFKLFDLSNNENLKDFTRDSYINSLFNFNTHYYGKKEYNTKHLLAFLDNKRSINIDYYSENISQFNLKLNSITSYTSLKRFVLYNTEILYSTYTLGINNNFIFLLCIKQEYIYYVKLCILANKEIEFDCFYILVRNNGKNLLTNNWDRRMYTRIVTSIRNYGSNLIYVDSIENEINKQVKLSKFDTMKDYNLWLDNIKDGFLNSFKSNKTIEEPLPF